MIDKTVGFVGGGRIVRIILGGLKKAGKLPSKIRVSDIDWDVLNKLKEDFPEVELLYNDNTKLSSCDIIFIAVHPPVMENVLSSIKPSLKRDAIIISLVPKFRISKISEILGGFNRIVRMIPNAPSIVNSGYNPVCFSESLSSEEKSEIKKMLDMLGKTPEVNENKLEAYAVLTGMGPTYFWFQFYELNKLGKSFGLNDLEVREALTEMIIGALKTMYESGLSQSSVVDLIPVKPIGDDEEYIKNVYRIKLSKLYEKIKV